MPLDPSAPSLPDPATILAPAIDAIVGARPSTLPHFNRPTSRWRWLVAGWRAQLAVLLARASSELRASRTRFASGDELRDLVASEFDTAVARVASAATGEILLTRTGTATGVIRQGTRFVRAPDPSAVPQAIEAAEYESAAPVIVPAGALTVTVPFVATRTGPHANVPLETATSANQITPAEPLFDRFTATWSRAAGGADALEDAQLRTIARAYALGRYGPVKDALVSGALLQPGVHHVAVLEPTPDGAALVCVADASWAQSTVWGTTVVQAIRDDFEGFGCKVRLGAVYNVFVRVEATVQLRAASYLLNTDDIATNIRTALRAYFDDRPDWYAWNLSAVQGVIAQADRRILTCATATVKDRLGATLTAPSVTAASTSVSHYNLSDDALLASFVGPA